MNQFTAKYAASISSVVSGFDRLLIRGTMRRLSFVEGALSFIASRHWLLKDFGRHAQEMTQRVKDASLARASALSRPVVYVRSPKESKEDLARGIALEHGIKEGLVCVLSCVEPCRTLDVRGNRESKQIELVVRERQCAHLYHYMIHPVFGFMHARLQTWFPYSIHMCLNGREWLATQMAAEGLGFSRRDNCFLHLESSERAQELMLAQLHSDWPSLLNDVSELLIPGHQELFGGHSGYYWSICQSEWATDVVFQDPDELRLLYPKLVRHGIAALSSPDVMRFLGRKLGPCDRMPGAFKSEVVSDLRHRQEGIRIKHRVGKNSVKAYDKAYAKDAAVLRVETTMNEEKDFKVYRTKEGDPGGARDWRKLRRGVADVARRAQVCQACNDRYLDALAAVDESATLDEITRRVTARTAWKGRSVRALRPFDNEDARLLEAVARGEFAINGLRNKDLQALLLGHDTSNSPQEARRRSARVTRLIRMLRAHNILHKVPHTRLYRLTLFGRQLTSALAGAKHVPISALLPLAA